MGDEATHAVRARSFVGRSSREGAQWEVDTIASATRRRTATNGRTSHATNGRTSHGLLWSGFVDRGDRTATNGRRTSHGLLWSGFVNRGEWAAPTAALSRSRKLAVDAHHHAPEGGATPRTTAPRRCRVNERAYAVAQRQDRRRAQAQYPSYP